MDIGKSTNEHPVDISKLSVDEMDAEIKKGFHKYYETVYIHSEKE